jgi:acid phosphatase
VFDQWQQEMEPITARFPYMTAIGNHDLQCSAALPDFFCAKEHRNATSYRYRFAMPMRERFDNMWYSFNYRNMHVIVIDTETDFPGAPEGENTWYQCGPFSRAPTQLEWLKQDLEHASSATQRALRPWIIVLGHRPMLPVSELDWPLDQTEVLRKLVEPLFHQHNVDLYLTAHVHAYMRSYPTYNLTVTQRTYEQPRAMIHVVNGAAGNIESHEKSWITPEPAYFAYKQSKTFGYGILSVLSDTQLRYSFYRSPDGGLEDGFLLTKNH